MAFTAVGNIVANCYASSAASVANSSGVTVPAGAFLVAIIAIDNISTSDGSTTTITGITDSSSNTWVKIGENTNANGSAGAGATVAAFYSLLTTSLSAGFITAAFTSSVVARGISVYRFTPGSTSSTFTIEGLAGFNQDALQNTPGAMTITGLTSTSRLFVRGVAGEGFDSLTVTPTSGYTNFGGTSNGSNYSGMSVNGEFIISSATSQSSNPSFSTSNQAPDWSSLFFAIREDVNINVVLGSQTVTGLRGTLTPNAVTGRASESVDASASGWGASDYGTVPFAGYTASSSSTAILVGVVGAF
jgi:hypothetical protein